MIADCQELYLEAGAVLRPVGYTGGVMFHQVTQLTPIPVALYRTQPRHLASLAGRVGRRYDRIFEILLAAINYELVF